MEFMGSKYQSILEFSEIEKKNVTSRSNREKVGNIFKCT